MLRLFLFCSLFSFFVITPLVGEEVSPGKSYVTIEYVPVLATFAVRGGGLAMGYERGLLPCISLKGELSLGEVPAENGGTIFFTGLMCSSIFSPFSRARSLKIYSGIGISYIGAIGEIEQGGLESHFFIPQFQTALGWRFVIGKKRVSFVLEPKLRFSLILPGPTGSGTPGNLEWYSTGLFMAILYPDISLGVKF